MKKMRAALTVFLAAVLAMSVPCALCFAETGFVPKAYAFYAREDENLPGRVNYFYLSLNSVDRAVGSSIAELVKLSSSGEQSVKAFSLSDIEAVPDAAHGLYGVRLHFGGSLEDGASYRLSICEGAFAAEDGSLCEAFALPDFDSRSIFSREEYSFPVAVFSARASEPDSESRHIGRLLLVLDGEAQSLAGDEDAIRFYRRASDGREYLRYFDRTNISARIDEYGRLCMELELDLTLEPHGVYGFDFPAYSFTDSYGFFSKASFAELSAAELLGYGELDIKDFSAVEAEAGFTLSFTVDYQWNLSADLDNAAALYVKGLNGWKKLKTFGAKDINIFYFLNEETGENGCSVSLDYDGKYLYFGEYRLAFVEAAFNNDDGYLCREAEYRFSGSDIASEASGNAFLRALRYVWDAFYSLALLFMS